MKCFARTWTCAGGLLVLFALVACGPRTANTRAPEGSPVTGGTSAGAPPTAPGSPASPSPALAAESPAAIQNTAITDPAVLTFRAVVRDENRNHRFETGERFNIEVDVANDGAGEAHGVEIHIEGTPEIVGQLSGPLRIGNLPAGEHRRVVVSGTVPKVEVTEQAEVLLALRAADASATLPRPKKFVVAMRMSAEDVDVLSVAIDQPPARVKGPGQPHAMGIAIGIGSYRDATVATGPFAVRDATVMASYFKQVTGIAPERVKVLTDAQALRDDVAALFETWLPAHAKPTGTAYIYVSGRAVVEPGTGAVSLVPYDGKPGAAQRLYPLSRLQAALAAAPIERAVVLLELSLEPTGANGSSAPGPTGLTAPLTPKFDHAEVEAPRGKIVYVIGNSAVQDAHDVAAARHGLFTYYLLKGLRGEADRKATGRVLLRELCQYVQAQVPKEAQESFGQAQTPLCHPAPGSILALEQVPIARLK